MTLYSHGPVFRLPACCLLILLFTLWLAACAGLPAPKPAPAELSGLKPTELYETAVALDSEKRREEALPYWFALVAAKPEAGFYYGRLAQDLYLTLRYEDSIIHYRRYFLLGGNGDWAKTQYAGALWKTAHFLMVDRQFEAARERLLEALAYLDVEHSFHSAIPVFVRVADWHLAREKTVVLANPSELSAQPVAAGKHRVLMILVGETRLDIRLPTPYRVEENLENSMREHARMGLALTSLFWEAATDGNLVLEWDELAWDGPLRSVDEYDNPVNFNERTFWIPHTDILFADLQEVLGERIHDYDTFMVVWKTGAPYNVCNGRRIYISPESYLSAVQLGDPASNHGRLAKGFVNMAAERLLINAGVISVHEFFHIYENLVNLRPIHGYYQENRAQFPGWQGREEFDYYWWQMSVYPEKRN
ncbi:MAG: hypothetical protein KKI09_06530 [Spirochaetes bacterium]|nr:hypothetical protein [Spirochaetota bacterium]